MENVVEFPKEKRWTDDHSAKMLLRFQKSEDYLRLVFSATNGLAANALEAAYLHGLMDGYKDVMDVMNKTVVGNV
jgi:hypothetical protein